MAHCHQSDISFKLLINNNAYTRIIKEGSGTAILGLLAMSDFMIETNPYEKVASLESHKSSF